MSDSLAVRLRRHIRDSLADEGRVVLAVSGGLDSMTLLDLALSAVERDRLVVATFDHGTGRAAAGARAFVERYAASAGVRCIAGEATSVLRSEAQLRDARWAFLRRVARDEQGVVWTAHTADDQVETVLMRTLRDSGARGLAGLYAWSDVLRPLVRERRATLARYARTRRLEWVEDPSNTSRRYLRNRVRVDLLPALRAVRPSIDDELLAIAKDAATLRRDVESFVELHVTTHVHHGGLDVAARPLSDLPREAVATLWPAIGARVGLAMDRRGIERVAAFTIEGEVGTKIQLSGGWQVVRSREALQLRRLSARADGGATQTPVPLSNGMQWDAWSFRRSAAGVTIGDAWSASLPRDLPLFVRPWRAGDAMRWRAGQSPKKVKYLLSAAGVTGHERSRWPVVLAGDEIVWIPGVSRGEAATARSGRPGLAFVCEYIDR